MVTFAAVPPTRIQFKRAWSHFVAQRSYNVTCSTFGSNPQAYTRIWRGDGHELPIVETKAINHLESIVTAKFDPTPEDDGRFLICKAENPLITSSAVEDQWKIDVRCKSKYCYIHIADAMMTFV